MGQHLEDSRTDCVGFQQDSQDTRILQGRARSGAQGTAWPVPVRLEEAPLRLVGVAERGSSAEDL